MSNEDSKNLNAVFTQMATLNSAQILFKPSKIKRNQIDLLILSQLTLFWNVIKNKGGVNDKRTSFFRGLRAVPLLCKLVLGPV